MTDYDPKKQHEFEAKLIIRTMEDILNSMKKRIADGEWDRVTKLSTMMDKNNSDLYEIATRAIREQEHESRR